jgi:CRISPR-associated endonuclease/helicase Cas3
VWAHSANEAGVRHALVDHLRSTGALARSFASPFGAGDLAEALGLLHDAGKADCGWQQRLLEVEGSDRPVGLPHKKLGARMVAPVAGPAALAILGHHGGLTARSDLVSVVRNVADSGQRAVERAVLAAVPEIRGLLTGGSVLPSAWSTPLVLEMGLRLTFSALVDADHLDTAAHFAGDSEPTIAAKADMPQMMQRFEAARAAMLRGAGTIAGQRAA